MDKITKPIIIMIVLALIAVAGLMLFAKPDALKPAEEPAETAEKAAKEKPAENSKATEKEITIQEDVTSEELDDFGNATIPTRGGEEEQSNPDADNPTPQQNAQDDSRGAETSLPPELESVETQDEQSGQ